MKREKDYLALPKVKSKERTKVMCELPFDENGLHDRHEQRIIDFIQSLGFEITFENLSHFKFGNMKIDGIRFVGDFSAATSMGNSAYGGGWKPRKIRQAKFTIGYNSIITIPINKPIDKLQLINKIKEAIDKRREVEQWADQREAKKLDAIKMLFAKYAAFSDKNIQVESGLVLIRGTYCTFKVNSEGKVSEVVPDSIEPANLEDVLALPKAANKFRETVLTEKGVIESLGPTGVNSETPNCRGWIFEGETKLT